MADEVPEDINLLDDQQLADALEAARTEFAGLAAKDTLPDGGIDAMRALATRVEEIRALQTQRVKDAQAAAAEIDALAAKVRGDGPEDAGSTDDNAPVGGDAEPASATPEPTEPEQPQQDVHPAQATASIAPRPALNLASVRARQPKVLPEAPASTIITAAVDVPGYTPGQELSFDNITAGLISRANALKTANGGVGQVISYRHPYPQDLIVTDSSSAPEGTTVALNAASQRRLPQGDLVASGGWCAPSETIYAITDIACPDMLWDAPEIQLARGGLRYYKTPSLDVGALTWVHTEADDIAGNEKPCFKIPCPDPVEVRCDAIGVCLESGILTQRHFPELVSWYLRNAMVAHEMRIKAQLFQQVLNSATPVVMPPTFGALSAVFAAVALQAADMIERHSLCEGTALEVVFPYWARQLFLSDLARQNGVNICDLDPNCIQNTFTKLGVSVQFARGLAPAVPADIGGADPAAQWPAEITFVIYPAGSIQIGRGEEINLGVIHDSAKFKFNDFTALFVEECSAVVDRSPDTRRVTVPVCPDGATGAQLEMVCAAGSPAESPGAIS